MLLKAAIKTNHSSYPPVPRGKLSAGGGGGGGKLSAPPPHPPPPSVSATGRTTSKTPASPSLKTSTTALVKEQTGST